MVSNTASFRRVSASGLAVTICGVLPLFLTGGLSVQIRESIQMTSSVYGAAVATYFIVSAASSVWMGRVAESIGSRRGQQIACLLAASSLGVTALWARSPAALAAALAIGGLGNSISQVSTNLSIAQLIGGDRKGFAFGIKQAGIPAATLIGGLAVPFLGLTVGWRWAFAIGAAFTLGVYKTIPHGTVKPTNAPRHRAISRKQRQPLILLAVAAAFGSSAGNAVGAFFVPSTVDGGSAPEVAGILFAVGGGTCLLSRTLLGWRTDRWSGGRLLVVAWMFIGGSVGSMLLATRATVLLIPAVALTFGAGWGWPGLFNFAIVLRNMEAPAAATGITQTGAYIGGISGSLIFGQIVQRYSYSTAWKVAAGWALVAAVFSVLARRSFLANKVESCPI